MNEPFKNDSDVQKTREEESREERLARVRARLQAGFYARPEVMRDVADAMFYDPSAFENLP